MALTALAIYLIWFLLAFGVRTLVGLRRTGDSGWRGVSGSPFTLDWFAGALFAVALVVGVATPVAALAGLGALVDSAALSAVSIGVALAGVATTLAAQLSMGDAWRIGVDERERTELVTDGAFRVARNPIFTAMAVTGVGLALMVPNAVALAALAALVLALELQVRGVEEPHLHAVHGSRYVAYAARVGRFVPRLGRLRAAELSSFDDHSLRP